MTYGVVLFECGGYRELLDAAGKPYAFATETEASTMARVLKPDSAAAGMCVAFEREAREVLTDAVATGIRAGVRDLAAGLNPYPIGSAPARLWEYARRTIEARKAALNYPAVESFEQEAS